MCCLTTLQPWGLRRSTRSLQYYEGTCSLYASACSLAGLGECVQSHQKKNCIITNKKFEQPFLQNYRQEAITFLIVRCKPGTVQGNGCDPLIFIDRQSWVSGWWNFLMTLQPKSSWRSTNEIWAIGNL